MGSRGRAELSRPEKEEAEGAVDLGTCVPGWRKTRCKGPGGRSLFGMFKKFSQARWLKPVISALTWGRREVQEFRVILYTVSSEASKPGIQDTLSKTYPRKGGKEVRENNRETK